MKYFSMFSGIGGFELGIQRAFDNRPDLWNGLENLQDHSSDSAKPQARAVCIGYSEIDKYAIKDYERQFNGNSSDKQTATIEQVGKGRNGNSDEARGNVYDRQPPTFGHVNYGDATNINAAELPDFDLLVGGFPCQAFSVAGKRAGFNDTRGTLFFDIARILKEKQPRHLVLENVKGLLSHDSGRTFTAIIGVLTDLGYSVEWQVLNSKNFGVPQNRERVYIVGHLGNECGRKVFPIYGNNRQAIENIGYLNTPTWQKRNESIRRVYGIEGLAPTLPTGTGGGVMPKIVAQHGRANGQVLEAQMEDKSNTLTAVAKDNYVVDVPRIRRLTPLECERLQGFPDNWTALDQEGGGTKRHPKIQDVRQRSNY